MKIRILLFLLVAYFVYLLFGAAIFYALEFTNEEQLCRTTIAELTQFNLTSNTSDVGNGSIRQLVELLLKARENGVQINSEFELSCANNWNYQNAFFFAGTVITTIGYGNISPNTLGGKIFCIFFAAIGLPIFGVMFGLIGGIFAGWFKKVEKRWGERLTNKRLRTACAILVVLTCLVVFALLIPAIIFSTVENWTYGDAFYYSFITLTTIGFGDFVVGTNPDLTYISIYRIMVYFWILFGLAFVASVISILSELLKEKVKVEDSNEKDGANGKDGQLDGAELERNENGGNNSTTSSQKLTQTSFKQPASDSVKMSDLELNDKIFYSTQVEEDVESLSLSEGLKNGRRVTEHHHTDCE